MKETGSIAASRSIGDVDTPFWLDERTSPIDSGPDGKVDVAIIGAGITGVSCALALARSGLRVLVSG